MLRSVLAQTRPPDHLVVVDNWPSDHNEASVHAVRQSIEHAEYLPSPSNRGPAGGIAHGMEYVLRGAQDEDWLLLLDDDDPPADRGDFARQVEFARHMVTIDSRTAAVGITGARFDIRRARLERVRDGELTGPVSVDTIPGGHLPMYRVEAIRLVGTFDAALFFGFEELDYGLRLKKDGYQLYIDGTHLRTRRERSGSTGTVRRPSRTISKAPTWRQYYSTRNTILILLKHRRRWAAIRFSAIVGIGKPLWNLPRSPRFALAHLRQNVTAIRHAWTRTTGRTVEPASVTTGPEDSNRGDE